MQFDKREKLNTKEAAKQLNIAESTLHKYVKDELIKPVYDDWKQDGSRLFYVDDIERLAEAIKKPKGITISELAKMVGKTKSYIQKHIKLGNLSAEKIVYRGKQTFLIDSVEAKKFIEKVSVGSGSKHFINIDGKDYFLYQLLENRVTNNTARIIDIEIGKVLTDCNEVKDLEAILNEGFYPKVYIEKGRGFTTKKVVTFTFPLPQNFDDKVYNLIDWLYAYINGSNLTINIKEEKIIITIKPIIISAQINNCQEEISFMKKFITEGSISVRDEKIILSSEWDGISFYLRHFEKEKLKKNARKKGISMEQLCEDLIRESLSKMETEE
ncbi:MerR family transcriptional regulator [Bacillus thuringiensis]|uniref:DNA-binding protein n=1 Tax=Bacillus wiedmannii TaxID=1890302 RepID=A0A242Z3G2_9BACI|nr:MULTISPECIES: helix-turn-helix domain-containing protein [Bacillus cereus group]MBG9753058.1 MerR family transcriptional regulator [Bacillus thuringiensis]MBG9778118.1 MerR family transcriptional regulator [Bacillus thuringiensis]OTX86860.1 DNA-binding protein [Bacillus wiedmannii]OTZ80823.1 DNA-binding protein [Bacillus thuringiensis serovar ostriniae]PFA92953.1 DNA-binding protein [Bacillus cereus]